MDFNTTDLFNWIWEGANPFVVLVIVTLVVKALLSVAKVLFGNLLDKLIRGL